MGPPMDPALYDTTEKRLRLLSAWCPHWYMVSFADDPPECVGCGKTRDQIEGQS